MIKADIGLQIRTMRDVPDRRDLELRVAGPTYRAEICEEETLFKSLIKLGLYYSLIGDHRLDPMVFELINADERQAHKRAADRTASRHSKERERDADIREAA